MREKPKLIATLTSTSRKPARDGDRMFFVSYAAYVLLQWNFGCGVHSDHAVIKISAPQT